MSTERLTRLAGLAALISSALFALFPLLHPNHDADGYRSQLWIPAHLLIHVAAISYLFAFPAIFARQGERNGLLGLAGYVLATIGTAQMLMVAWVEFFIIPFLGLQMPELESAPPPGVETASLIMHVSLAIGYTVLGLAIMRARVLPRGSGLLLAIASPISNLNWFIVEALFPGSGIDLFVFANTLSCLAMGWVGLGLWTGPTLERLAVRGARSPVVAPTGAPAVLAHPNA